MKTEVAILTRATYQSNADGTKKTDTSEDAMAKKIGQAKSIRAQWVGFRRSPNARVTFSMWETCAPDIRPSEEMPGQAAFFTSAANNILRPVPSQINGPFAANVSFTLDVDASAGGGRRKRRRRRRHPPRTRRRPGAPVHVDHRRCRMAR